MSLFFFSVSAHIDRTWGESGGLILPLLDVLGLLGPSFGKRESWNAELPPAEHAAGHAPRPVDAAPETLVLHPLGSLRVSQRAVPLELGSRAWAPSGRRTRTASRSASTAAGSHARRRRRTLRGRAVPRLDDAAKLSRPAFESMQGGVSLSVAGQSLASAHAVMRVVRYEEAVVDTNYRRFSRRFARFAGVLFEHFLRGNAPAARRCRNAGRDESRAVRRRRRRARRGVRARLHPRQRPVAPVFGSDAAARDDARDRLAADPGLAGELHVIPAFEAARRMTAPLGTYTFLPWLRQGLANRIGTAGAGAPARAGAASTSS